jgi:hypothetical protein
VIFDSLYSFSPKKRRGLLKIMISITKVVQKSMTFTKNSARCIHTVANSYNGNNMKQIDSFQVYSKSNLKFTSLQMIAYMNSSEVTYKSQDQ